MSTAVIPATKDEIDKEEGRVKGVAGPPLTLSNALSNAGTLGEIVMEEKRPELQRGQSKGILRRQSKFLLDENIPVSPQSSTSGQRRRVTLELKKNSIFEVESWKKYNAEGGDSDGGTKCCSLM
eukprot:TRINITY_DN3579_c0_g1_i2.p2 TRINITY_DN3579_c0_g1~~TRINITY_DN3579_c0_g1_i2.p2  ORF type:complete len:124 (+),score=27.28 TRINITY_DN3579_c0_g1_i2:118-489(+)